MSELETAVVNAKGAARIAGGHPWVYRPDVVRGPKHDATDGGPSAPRLRYIPNQGFHGIDMFVLALAVGSGSADIPVTVDVVRDQTAPVVRLTKKPRVLKHAVVIRPRCSEVCSVKVTLRRGHRRVSLTDVFEGRRAMRVPKPAGHGRLHWSLVARDQAGNRSTVTSGRF